MKTLNSIPHIGHFRSWVLIINLLALTLLTSCSSSSSSDSSTPPEAQNNLEGRVFVLGAQVDDFGNLALYAVGTDLSGAALTVAELQTASVIVDGVSYNTNDDPELTITAVGDGDKILSLGLLTDFSTSIKYDMDIVTDVLTQVLDSMPLVYEAQVMTFSDKLETQLAWSEDSTAIKAAVLTAHSVRNHTALYDSMGVALEGDADTDGLVDRCRPAHMLVVFTDGDDNFSSVYSDTGLATIVNNDRTVAIMIGTGNAKIDVLTTLAGDYGVVVRAADQASLVTEVDKWASSLNNMVKITLDSSINTTGKTVGISVGSQITEVTPNSHCTLPP
jgi:hypothetical protein